MFSPHVSCIPLNVELRENKTSFRKIYFFPKSNYGKLRHLVGGMIEIYIIFLVVSWGEGPKQHRTMNKTFNMQII